MYSKIQDFTADWKVEEQSTLTIFAAIKNEVKATKINENVRSLERLAWHITQTLTEMPSRAGIIEKDVLDNKPIPDSFSEIIQTYQQHSDELIRLLKENWKDDELTDSIEVYGGQKWEKRKILDVLVKHQIHHRGQMTAIMRLLDNEVPGIYGPAKQEWAKFGMEVQE
ncbi:DinB family protein [Bacteroidota bacterium]